MKGCFKFVVIAFLLLCTVSFGLYTFSPTWRERMMSATHGEPQAVTPRRTFSQILGKGPPAADAWLGTPTIFSTGGRNYNAGGYEFTLSFDGASLTKITIGLFPEDKKPKSPQDVARLIGPDIKVGSKNERGVLEHYFCSGEGGVWEMLLTPDDDGYSIANITPPKN
jgi:hypothetical protein